MRCLVLVAGAAAGCASVSVDPGALANDLPAATALDDVARARAADLGARSLAAATDGRLAEASADAGAALQLDPAQARALAARGLVAMHQAQSEDPPALVAWRMAEGELLRAQALAPNDTEVALALARFYVADGHGEAALAVLEPLLARDSMPALRLAGGIAYEAKQERRAHGYLGRLLASVPDDAEACYRLAHCEAVMAQSARDEAAKLQGWQRTIERFARYRALAPADVQGLLGEAQARVARWQQAAEKDESDLRKALELYRVGRTLDGQAPEPPFGEGVVLQAMRDEVGAEAAYREALRRRVAHAPSLLNLAALLAARGDAAQARALWENALGAGLTPQERRKVEGLLAGQ